MFGKVYQAEAAAAGGQPGGEAGPGPEQGAAEQPGDGSVDADYEVVDDDNK